jgi:hypothetical protein
MDGEGKILFAADYGGKRLWLSRDSGATWTEPRPAGNIDQDWQVGAVSNDGNRLAALQGNNSGRLYAYSNAYGFTVNGDVKHGKTSQLGDYLSFDGTGDYLNLTNSLGGSDFNLAASGSNANFSVIAIFTPDSTSASECSLMAKSKSTTNQRGWILQRYGSRVGLYISTNGSAFSTNNYSDTGTISAGKTSLVVATYEFVADGTSKMRTYVDGNPVVSTDVAAGPVYSNTSDVMIGTDGDGDSGRLYTGKIHYLAFLKGVVISQAQYTAMYNQLKASGLIPAAISNTTSARKLSVTFDVKCLFSSTTDQGFERQLLAFYGSTGSASYNKNAFVFGVYQGGPYLDTWSGAVTPVEKIIQGSARTDWNQWHTYSAYFDFSDVSNSSYSIDGAAIAHALSGTQSISFVDTALRIGQTYTGTPVGNCYYRNLRIKVLQ